MTRTLKMLFILFFFIDLFSMNLLVAQDTANNQNNKEENSQQDQPSKEQKKTPPIASYYLPALIPASFLLPGSSHFIRGEKKTGWRLLERGGAAFGVFLAAAYAVAKTGAADQVTALGVPILISSGMLWFSSSIADVIGATSNIREVFTPKVESSAWLTYTRIETDPLDRLHWLGFDGNISVNQWSLMPKILTRAESENHMYGLSAEYRWTTSVSINAGWLKEDNPQDYYERDRYSGQVNIKQNLSEIGLTLNNLNFKMWLGYSINLIKYDSLSSRDAELAALGGGELVQNLSSKVSVLYGYSHTKDGIYGSPSGGYTGQFYTGSQWNLHPKMFLSGRILTGYSRVYELSVGAKW